jgi:hypothetical protein
VSTTVTVREAVLAFPQASVAVHVWTTVWDPTQLPGAIDSSNSIEAVLHTSLNTGTAEGMAELQEIKVSAGTNSISGASLSVTTTRRETKVALPHASVTV